MVAGRKAVGTEAYVVGRDVAVTPGKVIFRNRLIELNVTHSDTQLTLLSGAPITITLNNAPLTIHHS